jgi:branched-chain amino acid transport system permease protein
VLSQLLANGLVAGCGYAIVALGFALIYNTTRIFHFAHGAVYVVSAYLLYVFHNLWHLPPVLALVLTPVAAALFGVAIDEALYQPLARRGSSQLIQMLSSLGLYIVLVNVVAMVFGNEPRVLSSGSQPTFEIGGIILTRIQSATLACCVLILVGLLLVLRLTRLGRTMRALRDDPDLVAAMGVNPRRVRWAVFALGSALAAVAAMLSGLDVGIDPSMGMTAVLNGAVAVIVGGIGIFEGAALGGLAIGMLQGLAIWRMSARWQDAVTFVILIVFLLFRPQGVLGGRRRAEELAR